MKTEPSSTVTTQHRTRAFPVTKDALYTRCGVKCSASLGPLRLARPVPGALSMTPVLQMRMLRRSGRPHSKKQQNQDANPCPPGSRAQGLTTVPWFQGAGGTLHSYKALFCWWNALIQNSSLWKEVIKSNLVSWIKSWSSKGTFVLKLCEIQIKSILQLTVLYQC